MAGVCYPVYADGDLVGSPVELGRAIALVWAKMEERPRAREGCVYLELNGGGGRSRELAYMLDRDGDQLVVAYDRRATRPVQPLGARSRHSGLADSPV